MKGQLDLVGGDTIVVSPTQLATLQTCFRMWKHRYVDGRTHSRVAPARDGGKAFDAALNLRYQQSGNQPATPQVEQAMIDVVQASMRGLELPMDEWRTPARYIEAVQLYNQTYRDEAFDVLGVQLPFEVELGEVPVSDAFWKCYYATCQHVWLPMTSQGYRPCQTCKARWVGNKDSGEAMIYYPDKAVRVRLHGILDRLIRHRQTGLVLVLDTKTASQWGTTSQASYDNHGQMKAYAWAVPEVKRQLGDQAGPPWATLPDQVHGCMVDAVVLREPYRRPEAAKAANAKPRTEFHRFVVTYSQERLLEWRSDALRWVKMALDCVADGHFPQNETSCHAHFGRPCEYLDVCMVPKAQRDMVLQSDAFQDYDRGPLSQPPNHKEAERT